MNQPTAAPSGGSNAMKRYLPVIAIAVVAVLVLALLLWPKGGDESSGGDTTDRLGITGPPAAAG